MAAEAQTVTDTPQKLELKFLAQTKGVQDQPLIVMLLAKQREAKRLATSASLYAVLIPIWFLSQFVRPQET